MILSQVVFVQHGDTQGACWVHRRLREPAEFPVRPFCSLRPPLSGQEVQAVQIFVVRREEHLVVGLFDADDGLEDGAFTVLNPLSHGMKVGSKSTAAGKMPFGPCLPILRIIVSTIRSGSAT